MPQYNQGMQQGGMQQDMQNNQNQGQEVHQENQNKQTNNLGLTQTEGVDMKYKEFYSTSVINPKYTDKEGMESLFKLFDMNSNGKLSVAEFDKGLRDISDI